MIPYRCLHSFYIVCVDFFVMQNKLVPPQQDAGLGKSEVYHKSTALSGWCAFWSLVHV